MGPTDTIAMGGLASSAFVPMSDISAGATNPLEAAIVVATSSPAILLSSSPYKDWSKKVRPPVVLDSCGG